MRFGMDFGGTNLKTGIFREDGSVVDFIEHPLTSFTGNGSLLENLISHAQKFAANKSIRGGGLAIKGLVNSATGILEDDIGAGAMLAGRDLRAAFSKALGVPFCVENDARAYAWGEWLFGAGKGSKVQVCMTLGTGLGCALIKDQHPYQGSDALGGILGGHISIDRNGPRCPCGNFGCLEVYCSAPAFAKRIRNAHPDLENKADPLPLFFDKIAAGDRSYIATLKAFQKDLAIGIVNVIHAYGPDQIVLGGGVMNSASLILPGLIEQVHQMAWTVPRNSVDIQPAALGNRAAAIGAAFHPNLNLER